MSPSFFPKRYKHCSLSKGHEGECHFEVRDCDLGDENPVDPRCLKRTEVLQSEHGEPSLVRVIHIPIYKEN